MTSFIPLRVLVTLFIVGVFGGVYFLVASLYDTERTFKFSSSGERYPKLIEAFVDPADVKVGDTQYIRVQVLDPSGVVSVFATTQLDTRVKELALHPVHDEAPCTDCSWEGVWEVNDTSNKTYTTQLVAENAKGEKNEVSISWVDPCSPPQSGPWTLDGNCQISTTNGLEQGAFTIPSDKTLTLQNGGIWVYQSGYPISVEGTIAIEDGGKLMRSLLWVPDADGDGYAPSSNLQVASVTQPSNHIRKKDALGFDDCYDSNANAFPGQTSYFSTHRGDGSYDYNCNSADDKQWTQTTTCYCPPKSGCSSGIGWAGSVPACGVTSTWYTSTSCGTASMTQMCR